MAYKYQTFADLLYTSYSGLQTLVFAFVKGKNRRDKDCYAFRDLGIKWHTAETDGGGEWGDGDIAPYRNGTGRGTRRRDGDIAPYRHGTRRVSTTVGRGEGRGNGTR